MTSTPATNLCTALVVAEDTDYCCTLPHAHAGDHVWVDAMGLDFIDSEGKAHYRPGWNYAR